MKTAWKENRLGEVLQLEYGKPLDDRDRKPDGLYPVYGANGEKDRTDKFYFNRPSIIVGRKGSAGEINLTKPKFWPLDVTYFVTFDEQRHDLRFLYYLLTRLDLPRFAKGVKPGINRNEIYSQITKIPPLSEQRRIVGILDQTFEGIATAKANSEKNIENARAIFEGEVDSVFIKRGPGWLEKRLRDVANTQYGLSEPMNEERKGYKIFRMGEVQGGKLIDTGRMKFVDIDQAEFEKYKLKPGDVLFNRTNSFELVGKTGIFELEGNYCFASYLIRVLLKQNIVLPELLNYLMNSKRFQTNVKKKASKSINQANINATILSNESVQFPGSLKVQKSIVTQLDTLRKETKRLDTIYQKKLIALDAFKKSLLHEAFSGNL